MSQYNSTPSVMRSLFQHRTLILSVFFCITMVFGYFASQVRPEASFENIIPLKSTYIQNYLEHREDLKSGLGNVVRIVVATNEDNIFSNNYLNTLKSITDEAFYITGSDRSALRSLWTPNVRWTEVTEAGYSGGPVIPPSYDGSKQSIDLVKKNVARSGLIGKLVANNFQSTIVHMPLLEKDPETGEPLDYQKLSTQLETQIRDKYQSHTLSIHITGFAKVTGDLIDGAEQVAQFFGLTIVLTFLLLLIYSRCLRTAIIVTITSMMTVVLLLGTLQLAGLGLDLYSMLIPFLIFAIAVSHGVQIINSVRQKMDLGADTTDAAAATLQGLIKPGLLALISDGVGFATLLIIEIQAIKHLALTASIGVAIIIVTNFLFLPLAIAALGIKKHPNHAPQQPNWAWRVLANFADRPYAKITLILAAGLAVAGLLGAKNLQIGDLDKGASELHPDSRYNLDNAYLVRNYSLSTDIFLVMATMPANQCLSYQSLTAIDLFSEELGKVDGVQLVYSVVNHTKRVIAGLNEGNLKWAALSRNQYITNSTVSGQQSAIDFFNGDCSLVPILIFLEDHKSTTLNQVVSAVEQMKQELDSDQILFKMAAGNAGIEAATNQVVAQAQYKMLFLVYAVVTLLVYMTFRTLTAVLCIVIPLVLASILAQALMANLGIGVKVATLPVIALGVGIGVDYGVYIFNNLKEQLTQEQSLFAAYQKTLASTGKAVVFTGLTLALGVASWIFSPIKFQADMGMMLTFLFIWNMLGAVILLPALACFFQLTKHKTAPATPLGDSH